MIVANYCLGEQQQQFAGSWEIEIIPLELCEIAALPELLDKKYLIYTMIQIKCPTLIVNQSYRIV